MAEFFNNDYALMIEIGLFASITIFFTVKDKIKSNKRKNIALAEICHDLIRIKKYLKVFDRNEQKNTKRKSQQVVITHDHYYDDNVQSIITLAKRIEVAVNVGILDIDVKIIQKLIPFNVMFLDLGKRIDVPIEYGFNFGQNVSELFELIDNMIEFMHDKKIDVEKYDQEYEKFLDPANKIRKSYKNIHNNKAKSSILFLSPSDSITRL